MLFAFISSSPDKLGTSVASRRFLNGKLWSLTLFPLRKLWSLTLSVFTSSSSGDVGSLGVAAYAGEGTEKTDSHLVHAWGWTRRSLAWPRRRSTTGGSTTSTPSRSRLPRVPQGPRASDSADQARSTPGTPRTPTGAPSRSPATSASPLAAQRQQGGRSAGAGTPARLRALRGHGAHRRHRESVGRPVAALVLDRLRASVSSRTFLFGKLFLLDPCARLPRVAQGPHASGSAGHAHSTPEAQHTLTRAPSGSSATSSLPREPTWPPRRSTV